MRSLCGQETPPTAPSPALDLPHPSASPSPPIAQPHLRLQALDLQRCFQLDASALTSLLHASISLQPCLRGFSCLALSHLDLACWPLGTLPYRPRRTLLNNAPPLTPAAAQSSAQAQGAGTPHSQPLSAPTPTAPSSQPAQPSPPPPGAHATAPSPQPASTHGPPSLSTREGPASGTSPAASEAHSTHNPQYTVQGVQGQEENTAGQQTLPGFAETVAAALRLAPPQLPTRPTAAPTHMASNLQVLALNCCELSEPCLISISLCCPKCKFLFLGGSSIQPPPAASSPAPPYASQLRLPRAYLQALHDVRTAMAKLSGDPFVEGGMQAFSSPPDPSLPRAAPESLTASGLRQQLRHARQHGAAVQEGSIGGAGSRAERSAAAAAARAGCVAAAAAHSMPGLLVLELTMMPAPTVHSAKVGLGHVTASASEEPTLVSGSEGAHALSIRVQVWDLSDSEGVAGAALAQRQALARGSGSWRSHDHRTAREDAGSSSASPSLPVDSLLLGLRCAANCSNAARFSALHLAAVRGDALAITQLLRLGAVPDARERSGSSALFLASYHGHVACIKVLLEAGADVQMSNVAGEQPLYIAALRGHVEAVRQLVGACKKRGSMWLDPRLYGDGWSPLMAAAVANRLDVAQTLLSEAGPEGVQAMLHATNKYGQTALHVAARKGSPRLLRLLLSFVGPGFVGLRDNSGETALDVARNHSHNDACWELVTVARNQGRQGHLTWAAEA
ncbi:hypothetical protein DUNSADRAFT_2102 [Dunaliella salina]|uniref:Uncharacterized protein n=1 Tax=Dunaliella salina TaxID=3046 RepID=A0ABQ7GW53_DUNSA|nr:hypothetical protein DUNSADRAFT_2102 [Dunaliella salina]|eukprot:KAF5838844.1 hypothetical protein DUNSADRAFT_2102 [Dunaliella salina]